MQAGENAEHRHRRVMFRYGLTPRLMELLALIGSGLGNAEAGARMGLSRFTVKDYVHRLMERLQLPDKASLRRFAAEAGIRQWYLMMAPSRCAGRESGRV